MDVLTTIAAFREARRQIAGSLGLVPTMGYLHEGHLSLVRRARAENDVCAVWIFVNPTQFNEQQDLAQYPRDPARDKALLEKAGVDLLYMPSAEEIYPPGFDTWVEVGTVTQRLEGEFRPGHFRGVATVCAKFFNIMQPTRAYFGQKDAQQVVVIKKMVRDLDLPLKIVVCPTVREPDGLAMSSRNVYLNPKERQAARVLWRSLQRAQALWAQGERDAGRIRQEMEALIRAETLARIDYISVAHPATLEELEHIEEPALSSGEGAALASLAVHIGRTRLIDNVVLA